MKNDIRSLAIIAGRGDFPMLAIKKCIKNNINFKLFLLSGESYTHDYSPFFPVTLKYGQIAEFIEINKKLNITNILMIGAVTKPDFKSISVDKKSAILLAKILTKRILGDDTVLKTVIKFFENEGFKVIKINDFIDDLVVNKGCITNITPTIGNDHDIKIAKEAIAKLSDYDIGQSLVIAQHQIIAVEAAEGTDQMINRISTLPIDYKNSAILVKLSKVKQSEKADLPTIGIDTIKNCIKNNITGIAIEAGKTLIIDKEDVIRMANENKMFITAI